MARRSNEAIVKEIIEELAGEIVEEVFTTLKVGGIPLGLKARREIMDRVIKRIEAVQIPDANA